MLVATLVFACDARGAQRESGSLAPRAPVVASSAEQHAEKSIGTSNPPANTPAAKAPAPPPSVYVESVTLPGERIAFVLRGARGTHPGVFLHGLCGHGMGYLESFRIAAAEHGPFVAPHGDLPCGSGPYRSWSNEIDSMEEQIEHGLIEAGAAPNAMDTTLVGYSLGATRALSLARRYPKRHTRLILIGAPSKPGPEGLSHLRGAVMMAGERDRQDKMRAAVASFHRAHIPSIFLALPGAAHGQMGSDAERVMKEALEWLLEPPPRP